jgi:hypothetical protein
MSDETCKNLGRKLADGEAAARLNAKMFFVTTFGLLLQFSGLFWAVNFYYATQNADPETEDDSREQVHVFSTCVNYPQNDEDVLAIHEGSLVSKPANTILWTPSFT